MEQTGEPSACAIDRIVRDQLKIEQAASNPASSYHVYVDTTRSHGDNYKKDWRPPS